MPSDNATNRAVNIDSGSDGMANTVFILGAGASVKAGAPLMSGFIPAAQRLARSKQLEVADQEAFDLVLKARNQLQSVFSKSRLDLDNVEELFGTFEMATMIGRLGTLKDDEVSKLSESMVRMITRTVELNVAFPTKGQAFSEAGQQVQPPPPYSQFVRLLQQLQSRGESVAVITFNYDLALDYALHFGRVATDYCLTETTQGSALSLLKLHGSLNWGRCVQCKAIVPWHFPEIFKRLRWPADLPQSVRLEVANRLTWNAHCGMPLQPCAVIVPPTWNKGRYHDGLSLVWRRAAAHLSEAENIFVIGYSLPKTDEFFRYFYALGSVGDSLPNCFCIVNPDDEVMARFKEILGPTAASSNRFRAIQETFDASISSIGRELGFTKA